PDLLYVDSLIGPDTVNTMPDATVAAFMDHGTVARTVDQGVDQARAELDDLHEAGIDMKDVSHRLEEEGVAAFSKSFDELLQALEDKANEHRANEHRANEHRANEHRANEHRANEHRASF
ncbi:MAG: transaldolase family protein, partial [Acidimicrobiales bacterium]